MSRAWVAAVATIAAIPAARADSISQVCNGAQNDTQRARYCDQASTAKQSVGVYTQTASVWAGVAVVCTAEAANVAAALMTKAKMKNPCTKSQSIAAGNDTRKVHDIYSTLLVSQNMTSSDAAKSVVSNAPDAVAKGVEKVDELQKNSLVIASEALATSALRYSEALDQKGNIQKNLDDARKITGTNGPVAGGGADLPSAPGDSASSSGATVGNGSGSSSGSQAAGSGGSGDGSDLAAMAGGSGCTGTSDASVVGCAMSHDPSLPSWVNSQEFANQVHKLTGKSLSDLQPGEGQTPGEFLGSLVPGLPAAAKDHLVAALDRDSGAAADAGLPIARAASGGEDDSRVLGLMKNMMDQLNPKDEKDATVAAVALDRALASRSPAAIADDPKVNLFDRVRIRYVRHQKEML